MNTTSHEDDTSTHVVEYSKTAAALADLRSRYEKITFNVTAPGQMKEAVAARAEIRGYRTGLEKIRKQIKGPALERCRLIDAEAAKITQALEALEAPIDAQIKIEETRKEQERLAKLREEAARIDAIHVEINAIRASITRATGEPSAWIAEILAEVRALDITAEKFAEFIDNAKAARADAVEALERMFKAAEAQEAEAERIKAERAELARLRAADAAARKAADEQAAAARAEEDRRIAAERAAVEAEDRARREAADQVAAAERAAEAARLQAERDALAAERAELQRQQRVAREAEEARERAERERIDAAAAHQAIMAAAMTASAVTPPRTPDAPPVVEVINAVAEHFDVTFGAAASWILDIDGAEVKRLMAVSDEQFEAAA